MLVFSYLGQILKPVTLLLQLLVESLDRDNCALYSPLFECPRYNRPFSRADGWNLCSGQMVGICAEINPIPIWSRTKKCCDLQVTSFSKLLFNEIN